MFQQSGWRIYRQSTLKLSAENNNGSSLFCEEIEVELMPDIEHRD